MIIGKTTKNREAVIELEVIGTNWQDKIEVSIDTGFDGYLTLPFYLINRLGLRQAGSRQAILGDGNKVVFNVYRVRIKWHGQEREVPALQADGGPLIGMALLNGSRVTMDVVTDGEVKIENLS